MGPAIGIRVNMIKKHVCTARRFHENVYSLKDAYEIERVTVVFCASNSANNIQIYKSFLILQIIICGLLLVHIYAVHSKKIFSTIHENSITSA